MRRLCGCLTLLVLFVCSCAPRARVPAAPHPPKSTPAASTGRTVEPETFVATAYCQKGRTASGAHTDGGIVAADPRVLPLGTRIRVTGLNRATDGVYRVMDTGKHVRGQRIDVFLASCSEARHFGRQPVRVTVVR